MHACLHTVHLCFSIYSIMVHILTGLTFSYKIHIISISSQVSGIGKVSERMLNALDVQTCKDIHNQRAIIYLLFSKNMFHFLLRACLGLGSTEVCT